MTSQKAQIQNLIHEIDGVLSKPSPRLPWVMAGDADQQRRVLEQTRTYLLTLDQQLEENNQVSMSLAPPLPSYPQDYGGAAESAQQVLQAVLQEMSYLRTNVMQPLRTDVEALYQQRDMLTQEIRLLESERQQYLLPQNQQQIVTEFLQSLMGRLQENLTGQVAQMLVGIETQALQDKSLPGSSAGIEPADSYYPVLTPQQRLEQFQVLQSQSDQLLLKLDTTLRVIFESLQSNIQSYQESLSQGLDKMHNLGQQGEAMFSALVNRLAQQLGREASTYLQTSLQGNTWETAPPLPPAGQTEERKALSNPFSFDDAMAAEAGTDAEIDLLLTELTHEPNTVLQPPSTSAVLLQNQDAFDLSDLELGQPEHIPMDDMEEDITIFQMDQPLPSFRLTDDEVPFFQPDEEIVTRIQLDDEIEAADVEDVDASALDLLNQLNVELSDESGEPPIQTFQPSAEMLSQEMAAPTQDEPDKLFELMFGVDAPSPLDEDAPEPVDQHVADAHQLLLDPALETIAPHTSEEPAAIAEIDDLFGGLIDPTQEERFAEPEEVISESVDDLLGDPLSPEEMDAITMPSAVDADLPDIAGMDVPDEVDAIASLTDLIDSAASQQSADLTEVLQTETGSHPDSDSFIPAAPEEILLVSDDNEATTRTDIRIDTGTLHQLTADLSNFETALEDQPLSLESDVSVTEDEDWIADSTPDVPPSLSQPAFTVDETAEVLADDLFGDISSSPTPSPADPLQQPDVDLSVTEDEPWLSADSILDASTSLSQPVSIPNDSTDALVDDLFVDDLVPSSLPPLEDPFVQLETEDQIDFEVAEDLLNDPHPPEVEDREAVPVNQTPDFPPQNIDDEFLANLLGDEPPTSTPNDLSLEGLFSEEEFVEPLVSDTLMAANLPLSTTEDLSLPADLPESVSLEDLFADAPSDAPFPENLLESTAGVTLDELESAFAPDPIPSPSSAALMEGEFETATEAEADPLDALSFLESPEITPATSALFANDAALPPPAIPVEDDATVDVLFSAAPPASQPQMGISPVMPMLSELVPTAEMPPVMTDIELATHPIDAGDQVDTHPAIADLTLPIDPIDADDEVDTHPASDVLNREDLFTVDGKTDTDATGAVSLADAPDGEDVANAFTLEGLADDLFEDVPVTDIPSIPSESSDGDDRLPWTLEDAFGDLGQAPPPPLDFGELNSLLDEELDEDLPEAEDSEKKKELVSDLDEQLLSSFSLKTSDDRAITDRLEREWEEKEAEESDRFPAADMLALSDELGIDPQELEALLQVDFTPQEEPPLPISPPTDTSPQVWYLGIDLGTTGISAVLLNRLSREQYPIYWIVGNNDEEQESDHRFRLPSQVYLSPSNQPIEDTEFTPGFVPQTNLVQVSFMPVDRQGGTSDPSPHGGEFLLQDFKPYLKVGIPYYSPETSCWEPVLQWSDHQPLSLSPVHQVLRALMTTLSGAQTAVLTAPVPQCGALGLEETAFQSALQQLAGVIVGYPVDWSDTYRFNVREAILGAQLVSRSDQIFLVEDAIATLLSELPAANGEPIALPAPLADSHMPRGDWQGATLIINAGATITDLAFVNVPNSLQQLAHHDFQFRSLAYAGTAIDQDIICHLIYPAYLQQSRQASSETNNDTAPLNYTFGSGNGLRSGSFVDGWNWQPTSTTTVPGNDFWTELGFDTLPLPLVGEPDIQNRVCLQRRLISISQGQGLIEAARHLKLTLQQQDRFVLQVGNQRVVITRQDLGSCIFLPYIQRLNRELNGLLSQVGMTVAGVHQVICTGGTASLGAIARWLREKFLNATIIQDTYTGDRKAIGHHNCLSTCSRVAYGLASLPLHPNVLDRPRQQYSDYFLLLELLRVFPDQPLSIGGIMQLLEHRGIHTQQCHTQILALLDGKLPPGLVPTEKDAYLLTPESRQNFDYRVLLAAPLFYKQNNQTYRLNYEQWNHFRRYLSTLMASTHQKLSEPLAVLLDF